MSPQGIYQRFGNHSGNRTFRPYPLEANAFAANEVRERHSKQVRVLTYPAACKDHRISFPVRKQRAIDRTCLTHR